MQQYEEAINDLKKVNNDLFYDDLKQQVTKQQQHIALHIQQSKEINEKVLVELTNMSKTFHHELSDLSQQTEMIVKGQIKDFDTHVESAKEQLLVAYTSFQTISEKYEQNMAEAQTAWNTSLTELSTDLTNMSNANQNAVAVQFAQFFKTTEEDQEKRETQLYTLHKIIENGQIKNRDQLIKLEDQMLKQEEIVQSLLSLIQQQQLSNEEVRQSLMVRHSKELEEVKKELTVQKKKQLRWGIILGVIQIVLSGTILALVY